MQKEKIHRCIRKIKKRIKKERLKENYEAALIAIRCCASILYESNIYYMDPELELELDELSHKIINSTLKELDNETVLFYDGFGLDNRGLAYIYLDALLKVKNVVYVTYYEKKENIKKLEKLVLNSGGKIYFLPSDTTLNSINELNRIILETKPSSFFFYSMPNDVVGTVVLNAHVGEFNRFQINLTDHAFWLGANCIDYCLEFRDYGASISFKHRGISRDKLILLPYYPVIPDAKFNGFPFDNSENRKFIFSGGALYKTFSVDNKYYRIIEYIMQNYPDILFWYAGEGDVSKLKQLIDKYPNRIFYTHERSDFFEIIKKCYFYLSTYPVCGGLMFQYVAKAGKIPLTLRFDDITDDFLLNQTSLGIQFNNYEDLLEELNHIMVDEDYVMKKNSIMSDSVISETEFSQEVEELLNNRRTNYNLSIREVDTENFRLEYVENFSKKKLLNILGKSEYKSLFFEFPVEFIIAYFFKVLRKMKQLKMR